MALWESGIGAVFRLIVELFTCMDGELSRFGTGSASLNHACAILHDTGQTVSSGTTHPGHTTPSL